ncbi:MAG: hypothetical protein D6798_12515, partial [Deltaproteobacteria bacterium]
MRFIALMLPVVLSLSACRSPFATAQEQDTIEAYEAFLEANPNSPFVTQASLRLEELYLEKARSEKTLEAYDDYLARYPDGKLRDKAIEERRQFLFEWASEQDTPEAWQKFLDEYPTGDRKLKQEARQRLNMAKHRDIVTVGPVSIEQVNLAENPDGPLDGWGFYADVTVGGDREVEKLVMEVAYLGADGQVLDTREWPVVAPALPGNLPVEEEFKIPMKPGETRTFEWTTGDLPAG